MGRGRRRGRFGTGFGCGLRWKDNSRSLRDDNKKNRQWRRQKRNAGVLRSAQNDNGKNVVRMTRSDRQGEKRAGLAGLVVFAAGVGPGVVALACPYLLADL